MICAVLKGNAYGHGLHYFLEPLSKSEINYIACVDNWEFIQVNDYYKKNGIKRVKYLRIAPASKSELEESIK